MNTENPQSLPQPESSSPPAPEQSPTPVESAQDRYAGTYASDPYAPDAEDLAPTPGRSPRQWLSRKRVALAGAITVGALALGGGGFALGYTVAPDSGDGATTQQFGGGRGTPPDFADGQGGFPGGGQGGPMGGGPGSQTDQGTDGQNGTAPDFDGDGQPDDNATGGDSDSGAADSSASGTGEALNG